MNKVKIIVIFFLILQFQIGLAQLSPQKKALSAAQTKDLQNRNNAAFKALNDGKIEEALMLCEQILQEDPTNSYAAYTYAFANFIAKNYTVAEKYLVLVEEILKTNSDIYTYLGAVYYNNRSNKRLAEDFNKSIEYFEKAIKLNPNSLDAYKYRSIVYYGYYGINGLKENTTAKNIYYADLQKAIELDPTNLTMKYEYAKNSFELEDYAQAIPFYIKVLESPLVDIETVKEIAARSVFAINRTEEKTMYKNLWADGILLLKGLIKNFKKLETDENFKSKKINELYSYLIKYRQNKVNGNTAEYLNSAEYLAEVNEAINAGYLDFYKNRIEIYTFKKQFAKAEADKKSMENSKEKEIIDYYLALEKREKLEEIDFDKKNLTSGDKLKPEAFIKLLEMKKSRLKTLDKLLALNIPQASKDSFSIKRNKLAEIVKDGESQVINSELNKKANEKIKAANLELVFSNNVECINCDAVGVSRANYKKVGFHNSAISLMREARNCLEKMNPKPYSRIEELEKSIRQRENEVREMIKTYTPFGT